MTIDILKDIISGGENIQVEFKTSKSELNRDVFESICAFMNRAGGHLLLGVTNDGTIIGVDTDAIPRMKDTIARDCNNPQILNPTYYLSPQVFNVDNKQIIYLFVPESSQVQSHKGKIFDRNEDGDFDITSNQALVSQLHFRKQNTYSENRVYPYLGMEHFETELFEKVRRMASNLRAGHPWNAMTNEQLLESAGLRKQDFTSSKVGYTLAAALLFGKETTIQSILPYYKTDAICRKVDKDRYDDRDDIRVNLIQSYSRLLDFIHKHLPDRFHLEDTNRISLRDSIFREAIANLLVHREFMNPFPAKLIIYEANVETENWAKPQHYGLVSLDNLLPFPKNPTIAKFFKEIGWVEELGSGLLNMKKYCPLYVKDAKPVITDGEKFKLSIQYSNYDSNYDVRVLFYCFEPKSRKEILDYLGVSSQTKNYEKYIDPLIYNSLLELTLPEKPKSKNQQYLITGKGKLHIKSNQIIKSNYDGNYDGNYDQKVLSYCLEARSRKEVLEHLGVSSQTKNYEKYLEPLVLIALIELTLPNKPKSKNQQYITTKTGKLLIQKNENNNK